MEKQQQKQAILEAFQSRHATKTFNGQMIPEDDFRFILETARLSPSSFGYEPWNMLVIQNPEIRDVLKEISWAHKDNCRQRVTSSCSSPGQENKCRQMVHMSRR